MQSLEKMMMETREPLEWHFKQLDHSMGLSFKTNFNFAIVGHLLKGSRLSVLLMCRYINHRYTIVSFAVVFCCYQFIVLLSTCYPCSDVLLSSVIVITRLLL